MGFEKPATISGTIAKNRLRFLLVLPHNKILGAISLLEIVKHKASLSYPL